MTALEKAFTQHYPTRAYLIKEMQKALGLSKIEWEDISAPNLKLISKYLNETKSANSAKTYIATIQAFIHTYVDVHNMPCKAPEKVMRKKREPSEQVVLTEQEIGQIERYTPRTRTESEVKARFLCEFYCMARSSDIELLTEDNLRNGYISYVSKKTHTGTKVPMHKHFMEYFNQRGTDKIQRASYNRIIKRICKYCNINEEVRLFYRGKLQSGPKWKFVGSHTARRSGATALALRGVPISVICQMMNHGNNIATTQRYIISDTLNLGSEAMKFFG